MDILSVNGKMNGCFLIVGIQMISHDKTCHLHVWSRVVIKRVHESMNPWMRCWIIWNSRLNELAIELRLTAIFRVEPWNPLHALALAKMCKELEKRTTSRRTANHVCNTHLLIIQFKVLSEISRSSGTKNVPSSLCSRWYTSSILWERNWYQLNACPPNNNQAVLSPSITMNVQQKYIKQQQAHD